MGELSIEALESWFMSVEMEIYRMKKAPFSGQYKIDLERLRYALIVIGVNRFNYDLSGGGLLE